MPRHNKQEQQFLAMKVGETRINGTNGNTEYWSGDNYGWQSENGYNEALTKEKERAESAVDKPFWDAVDEGKQALATLASRVPYLKEVGGAIHYATNQIEETAAADRANGQNGGDLSPANIAVGLAGAWQQGVDQFASGARSNYRAIESLVENGTGIELDDRGRDAYAGVLTAVAEGIAEGGAGGLLKAAKNIPPLPPRRQFQTVGATVGFTVPQPQLKDYIDGIYKSTTSPQFTPPGVTSQGLANQFPDFVKTIHKDWDKYGDWEREWTERISLTPDFKGAEDPMKYLKRIRIYRDRAGGVLSKKKEDVLKLTPEAIVNDLKDDFLEQHHLFPVADSAAFSDRMIRLIKAGKADNDDLVNMFMYADYLGGSMGHRWSNILDMSNGPHKALHKMHAAQGKKLAKRLENIQSSDELHAALKEHIIESIIPSKREAINLQIEHIKSFPFEKQKEYLEELYTFRDAWEKNMTKSQMSEMDKFIQELRDRGA